MKKDSNGYIFSYATIMVIIVGGLLSLVYVLLHDRYVDNVENEKRAYIVTTVVREEVNQLKEEGKFSKSKVKELFAKYIKESFVINVEGEKVEGDIDPFSVSIRAEQLKDEKERVLPVFVAHLNDGSKKYVVQTDGQGLYGPIWSYVSFSDDGSTVYGIVFDHETETPGLGATVTDPRFQSQFVGKEIFNDEEFVSIAVVKGGAEGNYEADAITGATLTSKGITEMFQESLGNYKAFFAKIRSNQVNYIQ